MDYDLENLNSFSDLKTGIVMFKKKMTKGTHLLKIFAYDVKSLALFLYVRK